MRAETRRVLDLFGADVRVDPDTLVADLAVAQQQMIEIAKAISLDAKVVVMDEPTAALNEHECEILFRTVDGLRARGTTVIYITHRMREVTRLADRVTVLKDGEVAARFDVPPAPAAIVRAMVGRDIADFYPPARRTGGGRRPGALGPRPRQPPPSATSASTSAPARSRASPACRAPAGPPSPWRSTAHCPSPPARSPSTASPSPSPPPATRSAPASACCPATARARASS